MTVKYDPRKLDENLRDPAWIDSDRCYLQIRDGGLGPSLRTRELAIRARDQAEATVLEQWPEFIWDPVAAESPLLLSDGPVFSLERRDVDRLVAWARAYAEHATTLGMTGDLIPIVKDEIPEPLTRTHHLGSINLALGLTYRGPDDPKRTILTWAQDRDLRSAAVDTTMAMLDEIDGQTYLYADLQVRVEEPSLPVVLDELLQVPFYASVGVTKISETAECAVRFTSRGHLLVGFAQPDPDLANRRPILETTARALASRCDYGFIARPGVTRLVSYMGLLNNCHLGHDYPRYFRVRRDLDRQVVPDAYAWQLLTDEHLARATSLDRWNVRPVAPGINEVATKTPESWLHPVPDTPVHRLDATPEELAQARADFGPMILDTDPVPPST